MSEQSLKTGRARERAVGNLREEIEKLKVFSELGLPEKTFVKVPLRDRACHDVFRVESRSFRRWIQHVAKKEHEVILTATEIRTFVEETAGRAQFDGDAERTNVRVAGYDDGIYLDLCDDERLVIKVTAQGWSVGAAGFERTSKTPEK